MVSPWLRRKVLRVVLPTVPACEPGKTAVPVRSQRLRAESSRNQEATACWLLSASRRRAARAWLALMELGSDARPGRVNAGAAAEGAAEPGFPGVRCAS